MYFLGRVFLIIRSFAFNMNYPFNSEQIAAFQNQRFAALEVIHKKNVLYITLNRPEVKNAINSVMMSEIAYSMAYAHYTPEVWAVVLSANGDTFCSGMDLRSIGKTTHSDESTIPLVDETVVIASLFQNLHKPVITKVQGNVYAGGFLLVGSSTYVIATEKTTFTLPEVKRGIFPFQVLGVLLNLMPPKRALELCLWGRAISATEAYSLNIIDAIISIENLDNHTDTLLNSLLQNSPTAIRHGMQAMQAMRGVSYEEQQIWLKNQLSQLLQTQDAKEGIQAFLQKRSPIWTGL